MERVRAEGLADVALLLRQLADEVETGVMTLGSERVSCADDLTAVLEAPTDGGDEIILINLCFTLPGGRHSHVAVEQELTHPGG